ncbi:MAG TPA: hypothetical protein VGG46_09415 [Terriglobales bacterium]
MSALILFGTVLAVLVFGIAAAYGTIFSILSVLAPDISQPAPVRAVLATSQSLVSGD